jgi:mannose-6-phosphate isomerase-like protein (cupin superfamily)
MGRIQAVFKADEAETEKRYSISEWWLEGTMSFLIGDRWVDAEKGSFVLAPGGMTHDFENRSDHRAGVLNLSIPGPFEPAMAGITAWFAKNPPGKAG